MESNNITEFSASLAKEIEEIKIFDVKEVSVMIKVRLNDIIRILINEHSTTAELEYLKLLERQSKHRIGSVEYIELGYKLSLFKQRKSAANRAANMLGRNDYAKRLKDFIINKYGKEILDEFNELDALSVGTKTPMYSTTKRKDYKP